MDESIFPAREYPKSDSRNHKRTKSAIDIRLDIADFVITHADKMSDVSGVKEFFAELPDARSLRDTAEAASELAAELYRVKNLWDMLPSDAEIEHKMELLGQLDGSN